MKGLSPFSRKLWTEFNRTKIQTEVFKAGDVPDCGDQATPPEKGSRPQFLLHSEAWAHHVRWNYRWHAYSMLITQPLGLSFMQFRPNVTRTLQSSKTDAVSCTDCLRFIGCCGGDARSQVDSAFALCAGFIFWICVSSVAAILVFKPSRENKCRGTASI